MTQWQTYHPPVAALLNFEECQPVDPDRWPDYVQAFGFTEADIPELLRLMQDRALIDIDPDDEEAELPAGLDRQTAWCAPVHAWRALGQLHAVEFLDAAISCLHDDSIDWMWEEFPDVFELIGPPIIDPLGAALLAEAGHDEGPTTLSESLSRLGEKYPAERDRVVTHLTNALRQYDKNRISLNSSIIWGLITLKAVESADLIATVYEAKAVEEMFVGSWPQAQVDLGLKKKEDFTEEELKPKFSSEFEEMRALLEALERRNKPDAYEAGLPVDLNAYAPHEPPSFKQLLNAPPAPAKKEKQGFGSGKPGGQKGKKKKK